MAAGRRTVAQLADELETLRAENAALSDAVLELTSQLESVLVARQINMRDSRGDSVTLRFERLNDDGRDDYLPKGGTIGRLDAVPGTRGGNLGVNNGADGAVASLEAKVASNSTPEYGGGQWSVQTSDWRIRQCPPFYRMTVLSSGEIALFQSDMRGRGTEPRKLPAVYLRISDGRWCMQDINGRALEMDKGIARRIEEAPASEFAGGGSSGGGGQPPPPPPVPGGTGIYVSDGDIGGTKGNPACWYRSDGSSIYASPPSRLTGGRDCSGQWDARDGRTRWEFIVQRPRPEGCR